MATPRYLVEWAVSAFPSDSHRRRRPRVAYLVDWAQGRVPTMTTDRLAATQFTLEQAAVLLARARAEDVGLAITNT